jgi:predicted nuclease of predicted toxin-antitoxin system
MKLLFDENLSPKMVAALADIFPDSAHVDRIGLGGGSDDEVWRYAKDNGFMIVSKGSDFYEKGILYGHPLKVIWVKRGNSTNQPTDSIVIEKQTRG